MSNSNGVKVMILDREYQINCPPEQRDGLIFAAHYLDNKMREMRHRSTSIGNDKLAIITALNITHDMMSLQSLESSMTQVSDRLAQLNERVHKTLAE